jgi:Lrp/AsnC family transcriptional regulator, leucine-responsive regulatory protein
MLNDLNTLDLKLLQLLQRDGRMSWTQLGQQLRLTPPAAADRAARLQAKGVIQGYAAQVEPAALGLHLTAFLEVTLEHPRARTGFLKRVQGLAAIVECHHVAGDFDYLLKVRLAGTKDLEELISQVLKAVPGVARTRTTIVLGTAKETQRLEPAGRTAAAPRKAKLP